MVSRLDRLRREVDTARRALSAVEAILAEIDGGSDPGERLLSALVEAARDWFTAGEVWRLAQAEAAAAAATGEEEPDLSRALRLAGIGNAHGLGRWLAAREGKGVERGGQERGGTLWRVVSIC